jgi:hypothetical protein
MDCVRDGSEHVATRSKAYSPASAKRLESNIDKKTNELASLTRTRPRFFTNPYSIYKNLPPIIVRDGVL